VKVPSLYSPTGDIELDPRQLILTGFYATAFLLGVLQTNSSNSLLHWLASVLIALFAASWCVVDARRRGKPLLSIVQLIIFVTWVIAVPVYLIATRNVRGFGYALLHAIGFMLIASAGSLVYLQ